MNSLKPISAILLTSLLLAGCSSTANAPQGFNLPPRSQIVPDQEPKPQIDRNSSIDIIALEYGAAFGRANQRLADGATNYENLAKSLAANR